MSHGTGRQGPPWLPQLLLRASAGEGLQQHTLCLWLNLDTDNGGIINQGPCTVTDWGAQAVGQCCAHCLWWWMWKLPSGSEHYTHLRPQLHCDLHFWCTCSGAGVQHPPGNNRLSQLITHCTAGTVTNQPNAYSFSILLVQQWSYQAFTNTGREELYTGCAQQNY